MIFPVTLGERDKDCGRTFHNNTNAYHAEEITSTHTKETLTRFILYSRMSCPAEILAPFFSALSRIWDVQQTCEKKPQNPSLINQTWNSYIICLTALSTVLFLHCLWNGSIHLQDERKCWEHTTLLHRPVFRLAAASAATAQISIFWMCVCVWARCSCSAVGVDKWVAPKPSDSSASPLTGTPQSEPASECVCVRFCLLLLCLAVITDRPWV